MVSTLVDLNPLLTSLQIQRDDKIVGIREVGNADANFIIVHMMKKIFQSGEKCCLVLSHNDRFHYENVRRRLGFDFSRKTLDGSLVILEPLKEFVNDFDISNILERLERDIKHFISEKDKCQIILEDVSHFLDVGLSLADIILFVNSILNLSSDNVTVILNNHESECDSSSTLSKDIILSNFIGYESDVTIEVKALKTGRSSDVTGLINVKKSDVSLCYQYKAFDRGVKTFKPGESLLNLYK